MTETRPPYKVRNNYPDETKTERGTRLLAMNNAAARRLGYNTMADLVGALRGAVEHAPTEIDAYDALCGIIQKTLHALTVPALAAANTPPADIAAILAAHPRRKPHSVGIARLGPDA